MIELTFLKELMLIKQAHQKSVMLVTISISLNYSFKSQPNVCNRSLDFLMMSVNLNDIDYHCIISLISKNETMNLLQNADLTVKSRTL